MLSKGKFAEPPENLKGRGHVTFALFVPVGSLCLTEFLAQTETPPHRAGKLRKARLGGAAGRVVYLRLPVAGWAIRQF
jgi:hypothetical protein